MKTQIQQEVSNRDNPDMRRFDILVGDAHAGFSMYEDLGSAPARIALSPT